MKQINKIIVFIALLICTIAQAQIKDPKQIMEELSSKITQITAADLREKMDLERTFILIDVRTEKEYLAGHIENAVWIPRGLLEFMIQKISVDPEAEIILYCKGGGRSALCTYALIEMGYKNVFNLSGGFKEWATAGNSIYNEHGELKIVSFGKTEAN